MMSKFKTYSRDAVFSELEGYCHHSKKDDFVEVTEWGNGEGYDIHVSSNGENKTIQLTFGEFSLIKKMIKQLDTRYEKP